MKALAALALVTAALTATALTTTVLTAEAQAPVGVPQKPTYIALALSDGPTADQRLIISVRGTDTNEIVASAYRACYQRAAQGYMHTCKVWYGDAWIVGTMCAQGDGSRKLAIGDDAGSPDAARVKAITFLRDVEKADISNCRVIAEYSANEMQTGLSVAKDKK